MCPEHTRLKKAPTTAALGSSLPLTPGTLAGYLLVLYPFRHCATQFNHACGPLFVACLSNMLLTRESYTHGVEV